MYKKIILQNASIKYPKNATNKVNQTFWTKYIKQRNIRFRKCKTRNYRGSGRTKKEEAPRHVGRGPVSDKRLVLTSRGRESVAARRNGA